MRKKIIVASIVLIILSAAAFLIFAGTGNENSYLTTTVQRGSFEILVYSTGQLEAQSSENILVPEVLRNRNIRIYEIKITDLIEEGTVVDSGDYVASLDHKAVEEVLVTAQEELEQALNSFEDAKMDSNLTLSNYRDQIINAREEVEEMQIVLDESVYESPAVIRKAEMDVDKAKRKLEQEIKGYDLRERQAISRVERSAIELRRRRDRVSLLHEVLQSLRIHAPKNGMLVYGRDRTREKIQVGSNVSAWSPVIATLPDLSSMQSLTWVNEIDISKVKVGQNVILGIDALPDREMEGEVISVANIGQPMPRSDAKVFEVRIQVFGEVDDLKPAMTTSNIIQTGTWVDTLFIPAEAVFRNDSLNYVFLEKNGAHVKQIVDLGDENENYFLVKKGLEENDRILLNVPDNEEDLTFEGIDIYREIKERNLREKEEEEEKQKTAEQLNSPPIRMENNMKKTSSNQINRFG
jgi:HlyD family secretion protein